MREATVVASVCWSPDGGIGRRAGLKHLWETVPVRLRLRVQNRFERSGFFGLWDFWGLIRDQGILYLLMLAFIFWTSLP